MQIQVLALLFCAAVASSQEYDPKRPLSRFTFRFPFLSVIVNKWPAEQQAQLANAISQADAQGLTNAQWQQQVSMQQPNGQGQVSANVLPGAQVSLNSRSKRQISFGIGMGAAQDQATQSGQAAHSQLIGFGQNTAGNLNWLGDAAHNAWMDFHHAFDGHLENGHNGLIQFGGMVERLLGRVSPVLAGLWSGFQRQTDATINAQKQRLDSFGNMIGGNIQHGKEQVAATWGNIRDNVDKPLHMGLGTAQRPQRPVGGSIQISGSRPNVNVEVSATRRPFSLTK